jgi:chromosome segregation ATPase
MTETKNNDTTDVAERVMELLRSIFDAETEELKTIAADLQQNLDQRQAVAGTLQEIEERIEALRDERRKLSNRMVETLLEQDDDEVQRIESRRYALSEQIEHLIDRRGHAISDLDGAVVDQEVVYQEAAARASAVEARAYRLKEQLKGDLERRLDEAFLEVRRHSEPMVEYRRGGASDETQQRVL